METLQRTANRGSISTGYDIENSAAFGGANGIQFNPSSDGNRRTWTVSLWLKRSEISTETTIFGAQNTAMVLMDPDWFRFTLYTGSTTYYFDTENGGPVYRDTSAWYNFVFQCDTTQGTAADRAKLWVNGEAVTNTNSNVIPQNTEFQLNNNTVNFNVGYFYAGGEQLDGYLADVHFTDGVANDPTEFGEFDNDSGIWKPKAYTGSYGTNGFYLEFKEPAASATGIGKDTSGNGHNFSTGGAYPSQATDTPTNNFCTWNPLQTGWNTNYGTGQVIVEGATEAYASTNYAAIEGSMAVQSGKWYWESKPNRTGGIMVGVAALNGVRWAGDTAYWYLGMNAQGIGTILGNWYYNGTSTSTDATDWTNGDIVSIALDMDNYKIYMAVNGSWGGTSNPATGTGGYDFSSASNFTSNFVVPAGRIETANSSYVIETNFGGYTTMSIASGNSDSSGYGNFEYAPPSGYYALCTKNLAEYG